MSHLPAPGPYHMFQAGDIPALHLCLAYSPTVSMGKSKVSTGASVAVGSPSRLTILTQPAQGVGCWAGVGWLPSGEVTYMLPSPPALRGPQPWSQGHSRSKQTRTVSLSTWITCWAEPGRPSAGREGRHGPAEPTALLWPREEMADGHATGSPWP